MGELLMVQRINRPRWLMAELRAITGLSVRGEVVVARLPITGLTIRVWES